jgi:DnaJ-class molecular chaperone
MESKDFYKILGVKVKATAAEIKKQYRLLAKKHHPDVNSGSKHAEERFKRISAAYEVLGDAKRRKAYDRERLATPHRRPSTERPSGASRPEYEGYDFHRRRQSQTNARDQDENHRRSGAAEETHYDPNTPTRGFDLQFILDTPLPTVALGGKIPYTYEKYGPCPACAGGGDAVDKLCPTCNGKRQIIMTTTIEVNIPPGVADQFTLRLEKLGCEGKNGGPPGDLLLKINTLPHPRFKRVRQDILAQVPLPRKLAEEGGLLAVETLDSARTIVVGEGTLTGEECRIVGAGAAYLGERRRGDFVVKFFVTEN